MWRGELWPWPNMETRGALFLQHLTSPTIDVFGAQHCDLRWCPGCNSRVGTVVYLQAFYTQVAGFSASWWSNRLGDEFTNSDTDAASFATPSRIRETRSGWASTVVTTWQGQLRLETWSAVSFAVKPRGWILIHVLWKRGSPCSKNVWHGEVGRWRRLSSDDWRALVADEVEP